MPAALPRKPRKRIASDRKLNVASVRKLAQAHTEAALQVLADVATKGTSEASRIAAAMALLDRGYGKSGAGMTGDDGAHGPILYHRIELIDGTEDKASPGHSAADDKN